MRSACLEFRAIRNWRHKFAEQKGDIPSVRTHRTEKRGDATAKLGDLLRANRRGKGLGIYSICSANRFVLEAGMMQAARDKSLLLIEATSNQVNQYGGYTGQTPAEFVQFVNEIAAARKFPCARILLGGDHLGPQAWRKEKAAVAMEKACAMVAAYVRAGFTKIHLDASMRCADDQGTNDSPLPEEVVSARSAELCRAAEEAHLSLAPSAPAPLYVIGTEVPTPGGEQTGAAAPRVTRTKDLARTLKLAERAFLTRNLHSAWERVIAVVVQPGVEFGDATIFPYEPSKAKPLSRFLTRSWMGVYEAHSTDYQCREALRQMVRDHFAILKVGPWLTFAFREAVFALASMEQEWLSGRDGISLSGLPQALESAMREYPVHWKSYYHGDEHAMRISRMYSYSDRARYYWPNPSVSSALQRLIANLARYPAPPSLLSQYLPSQAEAIRAGQLENQPTALIHYKILEVTNQYAYACGVPQ